MSNATVSVDKKITSQKDLSTTVVCIWNATERSLRTVCGRREKLAQGLHH